MEKRYYWKQIVDNGVLAEPKAVGDSESGLLSLNGACGYGFENECAAHARFAELVKDHEFQFDGEYVLISVYTRK